MAAGAGVTFTVPEFAGTVFFNLYMFSVGMKVGPQFLSGLRRDAVHFILLALLVPLLSLGLIFLVRAMFHPAPGMIPGIFAGAATATPGLGAAQTAISSGAARLPEGIDATAAMANVSTAFAFAYCISTILFVVLLKVTPALVGRDVRQAAREYEASIRGEGSDAPLPGMGGDFFAGGPSPVEVRAYSLAGGNAVGRRLSEIRRRSRCCPSSGSCGGASGSSPPTRWCWSRTTRWRCSARCRACWPRGRASGPRWPLPRPATWGSRRSRWWCTGRRWSGAR